MIFIIFMVIGILSAIAALLFKNRLALIASLAFIVLTVIIPVGIYSANIGTIASLEAFYNASSTNFQLTRDDTASYLSEEKIQSNITLIPVYGSIERMGIGANVATRVLEYRNAVNAYNTAFARYKAYKNSALYGVAYPIIPMEMRLLIINPVQNDSPNSAGAIQQAPQTPVDQQNTSPGNPVFVPKVGQKPVTEADVAEIIKRALEAAAAK